MRKFVVGLGILSGILFSCSGDDTKVDEGTGPVVNPVTVTGTLSDAFSRKSVLTNWVNNIIVPSYANFTSQLAALKKAETVFVDSPSETTLVALQEALFTAQKGWQHVAMFEFGKAEELNYRTFMNSYPVDFETSINAENSEEDDTNILDNINEVSKKKIVDEAGNFVAFENRTLTIDNIDFSISGRADEQGFAVVDYFVNGLATSNSEIISFYTTNAKSANYKTYLTKVVDRMVALTNEVTTYWDANSATVISNDGSDASASFDKLINDYLNYLEKGFREAKIATPSGKRNGIENEKAVESFYSSQNSKILFLEAYKALQNFYEGNAFSDNSKKGHSIKSYLESLNATVWDSDQRKEVAITELAATQYTVIDEAVALLNDDFSVQIAQDNVKLLNTFNVIQEYIVLTKTNMFQQLNVKVDFVDGDGD